MKFLPEMKRRGYTVEGIPQDEAEFILMLKKRARA